MKMMKRFQSLSMIFFILNGLGGQVVEAVDSATSPAPSRAVTDPMSKEMADDLKVGGDDGAAGDDDEEETSTRAPTAIAPPEAPEENQRPVILNITGIHSYQQYAKIQDLLRKGLPSKAHFYRKRVIRGEVDVALVGVGGAEDLKKLLETMEWEHGRLDISQVDDDLIKLRIQ